jgi:membrane-associated protease RseP (regulator of RpoE activity)
VIVSLNGTAVESAAQLRRMIKETPPSRVVSLGISRDGQAMTIKVQLADRHKSMAWQPEMPKIPKMPDMPTMPDFDLPVSVVVVHQLARSGLMVENITSQLGDFFGVKDGKGVLVRLVEKGSRAEKAGFRAGDVVVKVNNEPVHDTSDFAHAIRSLSSRTASVTVMRDKREQNLTLPLPEKKDSGSLLENSFDMPEFSAETEQAINRAAEEVARMTPAIMESIQKQGLCRKDMEKKLKEAERTLHDRQKEIREWEEKLRHELSGEWTEI